MTPLSISMEAQLAASGFRTFADGFLKPGAVLAGAVSRRDTEAADEHDMSGQVETENEAN